MRILFDTNVLLDFVLERSPFWEEASTLLTAVATERIQGIATATTITDIFYVVRRQTKSDDIALNAIQDILALLDIARVDRSTLEQAIALALPDFEDAVQCAGAIAELADAIVTRDSRGFQGSPLTVYSPAQLCHYIASLPPR
ncbi:MAG: PIN domain-containing protein [Synechococcales cyanobacterium CRU_2_2]|nr:PIN domain-containing protein [Synechococcales cyanobacterium CRU_2_2]